MAKACVNGYNIVRYADKSITECADLCDTIYNCLGFEYGVDHGIVTDRYNPRDCQPQSSSNTAGCNGVYWNLDFYKRLLTDSPTGPSALPSMVHSLLPSMIPSAKPSGEPSLGRPSVKPSFGPSFLPSLIETDLPSKSSASPTPAPSLISSSSPSVLPTFMPSDMPSSALSIPTYLPTMEPTIPITAAPTPSPTNVPTDMPIPEPTILPTAVPTAKCSEDLNGKYVHKISKKSGEPVLKTCDSLKNDPTLKKVCQKKVLYTVDHVPPSVMCKVTCETCNPCYENPNSKWVLKKTSSSAKLKPCKWLAGKNDRKRKKFCKKSNGTHEGYSGALVSCPKSCSIYSGIC